MSIRFVVHAEDAGVRLDQFLTRQSDAPSRSQIKAAISRGDVRVNDAQVKAGYALRAADVITATYALPPATIVVEPEAIPLRILHDDPDLAVVVKPAGMVVHPAPGHPSKTLVNALLAKFPDISGVGAAGRPGIVHRLDKDTSGVMVVAKNPPTHAALAALFAAHDIAREYLALCLGAGLSDEIVTWRTLHGRHPKDRVRFSSRVEHGKNAVTHVQVRERFRAGATLVVCTLETGRTHQIRVHLSDHNAPVLADPLYGGRAAARAKIIKRLALHATLLGFEHPTSGLKMRFEEPPPADFADALERLRAGANWR